MQLAITREQAYAALASLNPAPVFLESYIKRLLPANLHAYFGPPEEFFVAPALQEQYTGNLLVPILDDGNFGLVTFLNPNTRELIQIDVEAPDRPRAIFVHWQQYLAHLMIEVGEAVGDDDQIRQIAALIGFSYTDELFAYFANLHALNGDAWWQARYAFPLSIRD